MRRRPPRLPGAPAPARAPKVAVFSRCAPSRSCCGRCLRWALLALVALTILGTALAWHQDATSQRRAGALLEEARALLGQGEGVRLNYESEVRYKQALAMYEFSQAFVDGDGLRVWHLEAALLRLLRLPGMVLLRALGGGNGRASGAASAAADTAGAAAGWGAIRRGLKEHAATLRTGMQEQQRQDNGGRRRSFAAATAAAKLAGL